MPARAHLEVLVDTGRADAAVADLKTEVKSLGDTGGLAGGKVIKLSNAVEGFQPKVEKTATAVSGMASVLGGMGSQSGAALGAVSNLAAAFLQGGPLLAGIALATTAVSVLASKFLSVGVAAQEAKKKAQEGVRGLVDSIESATADIERQIAEKRGVSRYALEVSRLKDELQLVEFQQEQNTIAAAMASGEFDNIAEAQSHVEETARRLNEEWHDAREALFEAGTALATYLERQAELDRIMGDKGGTGTTGKTERQAEAIAQVAHDAEHAAFWLNQLNESYQEIQEPEIGPNQDMVDAWEDFDLLREGNEARIAKVRASSSRQATESIIRDEREAFSVREHVITQYGALVESTAQAVASTSLQMLEELAAGEEIAWQRIALSFIRNTGSQLMAMGIRQVASGAEMLAFGQPQGAYLIGLGAASFSAGAAMGGTSAVALGALRRGEGSGGSSGGQIGGRSARAPSRTGGESRTGGGQQTTTFVFNAPTFGNVDSAARQVSQLQNRSREFLEA